MNPTKDPNAYLAREIDRLANDYHAMGNHNRAIARDRISLYRVRQLEESQSANHAQMINTVKRGDDYDFHRKSIPWRLIFLATGLLLIGYAIVRSI